MKFYGLPLIGQTTSDEWGTVSSPVGRQRRWETKKKQQCTIKKTRERRKVPGLKASVIAFLFQGPEGPCSLRKYKAATTWSSRRPPPSDKDKNVRWMGHS